MTDGPIAIPTNEAHEEPEFKSALSIMVNAEGKIMVEGPVLHDKLMCYGILTLAEKALDKHYAMQDAAKIMKPNGGSMLDFARRFRR